MSVFPGLIRWKVMNLGSGGELEHFGKFESRHHAGTILKAKRSCTFCLVIWKRGFISARTVEILKANQDTWAGVPRTDPAGISTLRYLAGTLSSASFGAQPLEGPWRPGNQGREGCRWWKNYGNYGKEIWINPSGDKVRGTFSITTHTRPAWDQSKPSTEREGLMETLPYLRSHWQVTAAGGETVFFRNVACERLPTLQ